MSMPLIAVTADVEPDGRLRVRPEYADRIEAAGGCPIVLPCVEACLPEYLARCDGFVLTGGDDPAMEPWGHPTHPKATPLHPRRQAFEVALLRALEPERPVLGVCLGMQLMALEAGGTLDQHLPDTLATASDHWGRTPHPVEGTLGRGIVQSHHRQAIVDPGAMTIVATAPDGVVEAVSCPDRPFFLGVQWHPERTEDPVLGADLFARLVVACRTAGAVPR